MADRRFSSVQVDVFGPFPEREAPWVWTIRVQSGGFPVGSTSTAATEADAWAAARDAIDTAIASITSQPDRGELDQ